jgi:hypothetical protein
MSLLLARNSVSGRRLSPIIKRPQTAPRLVFSSDPPKPRATSQTSPKAFRNDPDMTSLRQQLYDKPDFAEIETAKLDELFCLLREYAQQQAAIFKYDEAQRASDLGDSVRQELRVRDPIRDPSNLDEANDRRDDFESAWQRRFDEFDQDSQARIARLEDEQRAELTEFERIWGEKMPRQYRKPSLGLLQLRRIEKALATCGNFDRAKLIHREVEDSATHESDIHQANLVRDYQMAKRRLLARHGTDLANLHKTREHERTILTQQCESERVAITNRFFVVNVKRQEVEKGYRTANRARSAVGRGGGCASPYDKSGIQDVLLRPLRPPNDPEMVDDAARRRRESDKKKLEFQQRNSDMTIKRFRVHGGDPPPAHQPAEGGRDAAQEGPTADVGTGVADQTHADEPQVQPEERAECVPQDGQPAVGDEAPDEGEAAPE